MAAVTLEEIHALLESIKNDVRDLIVLQRISPNQINIQEGLSDISHRLGLVQAGEFRSGNGQDPGKGFSGVRIGYPAFTYNGGSWNIVGVENDALQIGIRASDGKLIAGGGDVTLDEFGITFENQQGSVNFKNTAGSLLDILIYSDSGNDLVLKNAAGTGASDGGVRIDISTDTPETIRAWFGEDPIQDDRMVLDLQGGSQGARIEMDGLIDLRTEGLSGGSTFLRMRETATTPPNPSASSDAYHLYMKSDKLIIQYNDGGTVRYKYLDLTGTGVTWVHTTSAP